jgi:carbonic anhydrase
VCQRRRRARGNAGFAVAQAERQDNDVLWVTCMAIRLAVCQNLWDVNSGDMDDVVGAGSTLIGSLAELFPIGAPPIGRKPSCG